MAIATEVGLRWSPFKRGASFLAVWFAGIALAGGSFVNVIPPGVDWPYYGIAALIPLGAFYCARFRTPLRFVCLYGLVAGAWFALPIFDDPRARLAGRTTVEAEAIAVSAFAVASCLACVVAFQIRRKLPRNGELHENR